MGKIMVRAPDDALVASIVPDGQVAVGQKIIQLQSPHLDRLQSSIVALQEHIAIIERPINDGRLAEEMATMVDKASSLKNAVEFANKVVQLVEDGVPVGQYTAEDLNQAKIRAIQAETAYLDANLAASHAERKQNDLIDKITSAKNKLSREQIYVTAMQAAMSITSHVDGNFIGYIGVNFFVKKGQEIGEINT
jgi:phage terminase Nu1 subunit (DNA packaging protein)